MVEPALVDSLRRERQSCGTPSRFALPALVDFLVSQFTICLQNLFPRDSFARPAGVGGPARPSGGKRAPTRDVAPSCTHAAAAATPPTNALTAAAATANPPGGVQAMPQGAWARHAAHSTVPPPTAAAPAIWTAAQPGDTAEQAATARAAASAAAAPPDAAACTTDAAAGPLGVGVLVPGLLPQLPSTWRAPGAAAARSLLASSAPTSATPGAAARAPVVLAAVALGPPAPEWPPASGSDARPAGVATPHSAISRLPAQQPASLCGCGAGPAHLIPWEPLTGFGWTPPFAPTGATAGGLDWRTSIIPGAPVSVASPPGPSSRPAPQVILPAAAATSADTALPASPLDAVDQEPGPLQSDSVSAAASCQSGQASGQSAAHTVAAVVTVRITCSAFSPHADVFRLLRPAPQAGLSLHGGRSGRRGGLLTRRGCRWATSRTLFAVVHLCFRRNWQLYLQVSERALSYPAAALIAVLWSRLSASPPPQFVRTVCETCFRLMVSIVPQARAWEANGRPLVMGLQTAPMLRQPQHHRPTL